MMIVLVVKDVMSSFKAVKNGSIAIIVTADITV
jgi:hypothetical protein